jgi:hypothetical protein
METRHAIGADREPGNIQQRLAANAAVGRKENGEETFSGAAGPDFGTPDSRRAGPSLLLDMLWKIVLWKILWNNRRPYCCDSGLASPDSVLTTAEDCLLIIPRTQNRRGPSFLTALRHSLTTAV